MAKVSMIQKEKKKFALAKKYATARAELRKAAANKALSEEERWEAQVKLQKLPRNASFSRVTNRCEMTGRPRGYLRKFGLSRIAVRALALSGELPGVTKSSW